MSSFNEALKYLGRVSGRKATDADLQTSGSLNDPLKYTKRSASRHVKNIPYVFTLPAHFFNDTGEPFVSQEIVLGQFNYTLPWSFILLNAFQFGHFGGYSCTAVTIRWRVGAVTYRYSIYTSGTTLPLNIPKYTNQTIKPNFVIEFWGQPTHTASSVQFILQTNVLILPPDADTLSSNLGVNPTMPDLALYLALPVNLSGVGGHFNFDTVGQWLDNV